MATAPPASKAPAGEAPAAARRSLTTRAVIWLGLAAGTAVTVLSVMNGVRFPGLEVVLSVLVTWALLVVLAATVSELLRRHHRAMARHAWRHSKRGLFAAGRGARHGGGWLARMTRATINRLAEKAGPRWENRRTGGTTDPATTEDKTGDTTMEMQKGPRLGDRCAACDSVLTGDNKLCYNCGKVPGKCPCPPMNAVDRNETWLSKQANPNPWNPSSPGPQPSTSSGPAPAPRTRGGRPITGTGSYTGAWKQVVADTADFEPEDDGHLLGWMATEVNGMSAYAEAMTEVYETCVSSVGLDPVAMAATHDVADAAADAASAMAAARAKFAGHYAEVREFAANGGLLPFDGRWITGDGDA